MNKDLYTSSSRVHRTITLIFSVFKTFFTLFQQFVSLIPYS